jgi:opacity protein-like surface antigen
MKKVLLSALLAVTAITASALEIGVTASSDRNDHDHMDAGYGISLGEHFGKVSATGEVDTYTKTGITKTSGVLGYDVASFGPVTATVKGGALYVDQQTNAYNSVKNNGLAGVYGAGVSVKVVKDVALTADYRYQVGNDTVKQYNGSTYLAGVKFAF